MIKVMVHLMNPVVVWLSCHQRNKQHCTLHALLLALFNLLFPYLSQKRKKKGNKHHFYYYCFKNLDVTNKQRQLSGKCMMPLIVYHDYMTPFASFSWPCILIGNVLAALNIILSLKFSWIGSKEQRENIIGFNLLIICINIILICWLHEKVSLSSLNRHAVATREDVGIPKAQCLKKHFSAIFPECQIDARVLLYDGSSEEDILSGHPDFVLDCIDNIDTKVPQLA